MEGLFLLAILGVGGLAAAFSGGGDDEGAVTPTPMTTSYSDGDDDGAGTSGDDLIAALAGNDTVLSGAGNDGVTLGDGDDYAFGDAGDDTLQGDAGSDVIDGGPGNDRILLGDGDDSSYPDTISGPGGYQGNPVWDGGDDTIRGGDGDDLIVDLLGANSVFGDVGNDRLQTVDEKGTDLADSVSGGFGADLMFIDDGDTVTGGGGPDIFGVVTDENSASAEGEDAAVVITDFDNATDTIELNLEQATFGNVTNADLVLQADAANNLTNLLVAGQLVAVVRGTAALDPALVSVFTY